MCESSVLHMYSTCIFLIQIVEKFPNVCFERNFRKLGIQVLPYVLYSMLFCFFQVTDDAFVIEQRNRIKNQRKCFI